jgi:hypothetical protein
MTRASTRSFSILEIAIATFLLGIVGTLVFAALTTTVDHASSNSTRLMLLSKAESGLRIVAEELREGRAEFTRVVDVPGAGFANSTALLIPSARASTQAAEFQLDGISARFVSAIVYIPRSNQSGRLELVRHQMAVDPGLWPLELEVNASSLVLFKGNDVIATVNRSGDKEVLGNLRRFAAAPMAGAFRLVIEIESGSPDKLMVHPYSIAVSPSN